MALVTAAALLRAIQISECAMVVPRDGGFIAQVRLEGIRCKAGVAVEEFLFLPACSHEAPLRRHDLIDEIDFVRAGRLIRSAEIGAEPGECLHVLAFKNDGLRERVINGRLRFPGCHV